MAAERPTRETREEVVDRLRSGNPALSDMTARKMADDSLRRVEGRIERGELNRPAKSDR